MTKNKSVIVVGGGAAGLMSAIHSAWSGAEVIIFEKNSRPARKVLITAKADVMLRIIAVSKLL